MIRRASTFIVILAASSLLFANPPEKTARIIQSTPVERIKAKEGFRVELLYSVPTSTQGSWISLCVDPKGRLYTSDQNGGLFRIAPPPIGQAQPIAVEKVAVELGEAHGLVWANDGLYVVVNHAKKYKSGLYLVRDTNDDDQLDDVKRLREFDGNGEHGPHAVLVGPDKQSLYLVIGNHTQLTEIHSSRVPKCWAEDQILPRMWDPRGHAVGVMAPGGHVLKTDFDGRKWELISIGYRNCYDAAFNRDGELFTFDSDMEWDMNLPWYRPTRVCHVTSGSDYGWRSGSGKWPNYYPDTLPPVVNIGPGSPTGVTFGYGATFPARYQDALFLCDWSYGKLYALHLKPKGASYAGEFEEFLFGIPLPLTDIVVNPVDGAMYFTIGGRNTTSGLYRVTYVGNESTKSSEPVEDNKDRFSRNLRRSFERSHQEGCEGLPADAQHLPLEWLHDAQDGDRFLLTAARTAIEFQDPDLWQRRALSQARPQAALTALLALVRVGDKNVQPQVIESLGKLDWPTLTDAQRLELVRITELVFLRMGRPNADLAAEVAGRFDSHLPATNRELNSEIGKLLAYLQSPRIVPKLMKLIETAPSQEEQLDYVATLRNVTVGWTPELRKQYFEWFHKAAGYRGGASFFGFVKQIHNEAIVKLNDNEWEQLGPLLELKQNAPIAPKPRTFVKKWTMQELAHLADADLANRNKDRGRELFASTRCIACHRYYDEGGVGGPDLTGAGGRLSVRDLLEAIVEPSKVNSDQYAGTVFMTNSGKLIIGRIVNLTEDTLIIGTDMLDPNAQVRLKRGDIETMEPSRVSMMPDGLIDTCTEEEIKDLLAFVLSKK